jgi:zinc transporter ZupT
LPLFFCCVYAADAPRIYRTGSSSKSYTYRHPFLQEESCKKDIAFEEEQHKKMKFLSNIRTHAPALAVIAVLDMGALSAVSAGTWRTLDGNIVEAQTPRPVSEGHRRFNINTAPPLRRTQEQEASIVADTVNNTTATAAANEAAAVDMHDDHDEHEHGSEFEESASQASDGDGDNKPWGYVIGASLIVNLATLTGVVVLFPFFHRLTKCCCSGRLMDIAISTLSAGALMATALLLILPEASLMMLVAEAEEEEGHDDHEDEIHSEVSWTFGVSVLGGFLLPFALSALFPQADCREKIETTKDHAGSTTNEHYDGEASEVEEGIQKQPVGDFSTPGADTQEQGEDAQKAAEADAGVAVCPHRPIPKEAKKPVNWGLCSSILLGDGFHNFADGIFLGSAFLSCGTTMAVSVMVATLYHEIVQELADFVMLTKHAGLSIPKALFLNFVSGLSILLGGIVVLTANLSSMGIGMLLSMSAGVYIHIAAVEYMPRVTDILESRLDYLYALFMFALGATPIGLVLLVHEHCEV